MPLFNIFGKTFKITFLLIIIYEILSFWGQAFGIVNLLGFLLVVGATLIIGLWRLKYAFWMITAELITGSFGYMFFLDVGAFRFSVRLGMFLAILLAFIINSVIKREFVIYKKSLWWPLVVLVLVLILGVVNGISNGNLVKNVFFDVNAYLFIALIMVAFAVFNSFSRINQWLQVVFSAVAVMALKTFFLLFYFSHQANVELFRMMYIWVRDTRVGEISQVMGNYYRIFFQGHFWSLLVFIMIFILLSMTKKEVWDKKNYYMSWIVGLLSSTTLIISFSRSLWLALTVTMAGIFIYLLAKEKFTWKKVGKIIFTLLVVSVVEISFITVLVNIKLPTKGGGGGISAASLIKERVTTTQEAAIGSRFQLLEPLVNKLLAKPILGSGFGTTVTYATEDPRSKQQNNGQYTTYAFEWGYLDILIKIGTLGLLVYLFFISKIIKIALDVLKKNHDREIFLLTLALIFCIIALLITHLTTPYLNHPLGIFLLISSAAILTFLKNIARQTPTMRQLE